VHVHVLNLVFVPCIAGLAIAGRRSRRGLVGAAALLTVGVAALMIGQWWRFGDPLETGRFGYYSHFVAPWEGLAALVIAPGRSVFLYAPAVLLGLFGWAALRRRAPEVCWFAGVAILLRWAAISTRSDWFGGWGLGARHLVPVIPLAMLAFAATVEDVLPRWRELDAGVVVRARGAGCRGTSRSTRSSNGCGGCCSCSADYMAASHWSVRGGPIVGFAGLKN
jgi:hypothetical protein